MNNLYKHSQESPFYSFMMNKSAERQLSLDDKLEIVDNLSLSLPFVVLDDEKDILRNEHEIDFVIYALLNKKDEKYISDIINLVRKEQDLNS